MIHNSCADIQSFTHQHFLNIYLKDDGNLGGGGIFIGNNARYGHYTLSQTIPSQQQLQSGQTVHRPYLSYICLGRLS